ncbi:MAG: transcription termination/antitermination protein NusA [Firmicutes bacterium]|nr:transcription termination/antitermination protein NusA [Bacillota bacterium]
MDSKELLEALKTLEEEKGIDPEIVFSAIENALKSACKKNFGTDKNIKVVIDKETCDIKVYAQKEVMDEVYDAFLEISLEEAREIDPAYENGDKVDIEITPKNFGRIAAQAAKQVVVQKVREAERDKIYDTFVKKEKEIDTAIVQRKEQKNVIVLLGGTEAFLPPKEQMSSDKYNFGDRIKVYVLKVEKKTKGSQIIVSRTHYELVKRLFELEVPEIKNGEVEIKSIAREPGSRAKIAVYSKNSQLDAVGTCVGVNGSRVNVIVKELGGEKIDIVNWNENAQVFIAEALKPAKVLAVEIHETEDEKAARVVVPNDQLSFAIGKEGQNAKLAARLTGRKIDIKSEDQARATEFVDFEDKSIFIAEIIKEINTKNENEQLDDEEEINNELFDVDVHDEDADELSEEDFDDNDEEAEE